MICGLNQRNYDRQLFFYLNVNMWMFKVKWADLHDIQERHRDLVILPVIKLISLKNTANNMPLIKQLWKGLIAERPEGKHPSNTTVTHPVNWSWSLTLQEFWSRKPRAWQAHRPMCSLLQALSTGPGMRGCVWGHGREREAHFCHV